MAKKKSVVDELKGYNKELGTHLPDLDFDFLKSGGVFRDKDDYDEDINSLVASNLIDLKTEMALVRKNLTDSMEGMIMRSLNTQQSQFAKFMDDFYKKMTLSFKSTVSTFSEELGGEFSKMRKELEKISLSNKILSDKLEDFGNDFVEVKSIFSEFGEFKDETNSLLEKKFSGIDERLSKIEEGFLSINDSNKSELGKVSKLILIQKEGIDKISKDLTTKYLGIKEEITEFNKNNNVNVRKKLSNFNESLSDLGKKDNFVKSKTKSDINVIKKDEIDNNILSSELKNTILESPQIVSDDDFRFESNSTVEKLIKIDSRLKKLNSLR
jgi:hypothetical protein